MEIYVIPITGSSMDGRFIIYRPLIGLVFIGNLAMAALATKLANRDPSVLPLKGEIRNFLEVIGFFEADPPVPELPATQYAGDRFKPTSAVLLMTNMCQLRCTYCYAAAGDFSPQEISFDIARAVIDAACCNAQELSQDQFSISFHGGGEPTVAWKVLQESVLYARQKPIPARLDLTTNGILSGQQLEWVTNHIDKISLSMDGSPTTQDLQRPFSSGRGSSLEVMRTITELDRIHFTYGIRLTVTAPWKQLSDDVRFICEKTGCMHMQVEPAYNTGRGSHGQQNANQGQEFADAFLAAYEIASRAGRHLTHSGSRAGLITMSFCSSPYTALIANTSGNLVSCFEITQASHPFSSLSTIGYIDSGQVVIDEPARMRLFAKIEERRSHCKDCFAFWSCAGDCYTRAWDTQPNGHLVYGPRCETNRFLIEKLILKRINETNGVWCKLKSPVDTEALDPTA
jgi:uncharacterized protein